MPFIESSHIISDLGRVGENEIIEEFSQQTGGDIRQLYHGLKLGIGKSKRNIGRKRERLKLLAHHLFYIEDMVGLSQDRQAMTEEDVKTFDENMSVFRRAFDEWKLVAFGSCFKRPSSI